MRRIAVIFVVFFMFFLVVGCRNKGCGKNTGVKEYDLTNISFSDVNVIYDGEEHSVLLSGELPEGLEVEYENNKLTNVGSTSATATIKEKETQEVLKVLTATITISKRRVVIKVNDLYYKSNELVTKDEYQIIEGSILDSDYSKLNLYVDFMVGFTDRFAITYYGAAFLKYDPNPNYDIISYNGNVTFHNLIPSFSDLIAFNEKSYDEDYWKQEIVSNFESYEQIISRVNEYDINNPAYIAPWILDGIDEHDVTNEERVTYGRYYEEHLFITKDIYNQYNFYSNLKKEYDNIKDWVDVLSNNPDYDVWDWIEYRFDYTESDVVENYEYGDLDVLDKNSDRHRYIEIDEFQSALDYLLYCCCDITYDELVKILKTKKDYDEIYFALKKTCKIVEDEYGNLVNNAIEFQKYYYDGSLCYLISKDNELYKEICELDLDYYNSVTENYNYFKALFELRNMHSNELVSFEEYIEKTLLGYGGLATDYPNKPILTSTNDKGNIVELYLSYSSTTFKLIEKDKNGIIINSLDLDYQKTILLLQYRTPNSGELEYTFYSYHMSVSNSNNYDDQLVPNYSIYIEKDELGNGTKIIVSYTMKDRTIDYTYFPKYISKDKMDEYLERNKKLVENGTTTSSGEPIIDIKTNNQLFTEFCKTDNSYYKLVPSMINKNGNEIKNPDNKFGFDYYELNMYHQNMSIVVRDCLYKCLYEYSGYTKEDLNADNIMFNYKNDIYKPVYSVAVEYELVNGVLYMSIPKNSISIDEICSLYKIVLLPYISTKE